MENRTCVRLLEVINTTWKICRSQSTNQHGVRSARGCCVPPKKNFYFWRYTTPPCTAQRTDLCFAGGLQIFSCCVYHLEQPHAQFVFLFSPIVFGVNLIHSVLMGRMFQDWGQAYIRPFVFGSWITCHCIWESRNEEAETNTSIEYLATQLLDVHGLPDSKYSSNLMTEYFALQQARG